MKAPSSILDFEASLLKKKKRIAFLLFKEAYQAQYKKNYVIAVEKYKQSIASFSTAEAHTFLGWTYSLMGNLELAIKECQTAIVIDPDFGNAYNDIGAYCIAKGNYQEAVPYLNHALEAKRYRAKHYVYFNLGCVSEKTGDNLGALRYYKMALAIKPNYKAALFAVDSLKDKLNKAYL
ncbi:MAG: tetratricopeptide repeat protein [Cyanobacteria bacterium P01_H01_bin.74]